ncbi:MAG: DEAD/DEAH box helicase [Candidatus Aenigmarchaeota archaeon]|nr:DEAD/DEAH box helicase [Candidatus Aenigmarchaeota archaeon]
MEDKELKKENMEMDRKEIIENDENKENQKVEYVNNRWIIENSIEKREYQERIAEIASRKNTLCVLPTAMGKTIIALLTATKILDRRANKKILFLAPTRPLVEQHKKTFERFLKLGLELVSITGKIRSEKRVDFYEKADIIFSTPQCIKNDLKRGLLSLKDFSLLIVDEAQHSIGNYAYTYIASEFMKQTNELGIILALTASPSANYSKIREIKKNLFIEHVEIRTERDEDVKKYLKPVEIEWIEVELPPEIEELRKFLQDLKEENIKKLVNFGFNLNKSSPRKDLISIQNKIIKKYEETKDKVFLGLLSFVSEIMKIDYMIELLETQATEAFKEFVKKIMDNAKLKKGGADARLAKKIIGVIDKINVIKTHPKMEKLKEILREELQNKDSRIIIFAQFRATVKTIKEEIEKMEGCRPIILIGQRGKDGIKQKEQVELVKLYDSGAYNTLITTSIGEEGIHLGSATVAIFFEPVPSEIRMIQRRGRVGRERAGKIYILITKGTRDQAYYWASHHREKRMRRILERMKMKNKLKEQKDLFLYLGESSERK